jgi:chromosome segregation ATPase
VELRVDGHSYRQPLTIKPDPRVTVSVAAMQREFELANKVETAAAQASKASAEAKQLLQALDDRQSHASGALHDQIAALETKAADLSGMELHADPRNTIGSQPRRTDSLRALSANLEKLLSAVDDADADPSTDAQASYATLSQTLSATLDEWQALKQHDVVALNATLKAAGQKAIAL